MGPKTLLILSVLLLISCSHAPMQEYALARAALHSAKQVEAGRYDPTTFHRAEEAYRKGELYFKNEDFGDAESQFEIAKAAAEKAEDTARIQRFKTGEDAQ